MAWKTVLGNHVNHGAITFIAQKIEVETIQDLTSTNYVTRYGYTIVVSEDDMEQDGIDVYVPPIEIDIGDEDAIPLIQTIANMLACLCCKYLKFCALLCPSMPVVSVSNL